MSDERGRESDVGFVLSIKDATLFNALSPQRESLNTTIDGE